MTPRIIKFSLVLVLGMIPAWGQLQPTDRGQDPAQNPPPPRSDAGPGESSSKSTKVPLNPPPGEAGTAPGAESDDVHEFKPWDPHKADKNVEVGDYYFAQKNYAAAISRYREALYWKSDDAEATVHLARALEKSGHFSQARKYYAQYLKILPQGKDAEESRKALERLKDKPDHPIPDQPRGWR